MWEIKQLIELAADDGPVRRFIPGCGVGKSVTSFLEGVIGIENCSSREEILQLLSDLPDEDWAELARIQRGNDCVARGTCLSCNVGQELFMESFRQLIPVDALDTHLRTVVETFSKEGPTRPLATPCSKGQQLITAIRTFEESDTLPALTSELNAAYGCVGLSSCAACPLGQKTMYDVIIDIVENGDRGEHGAFLRDNSVFV